MQFLGKLKGPLGQLDNPFSKTLLTISMERTGFRLMVSEGPRVIWWLRMPFNPRMLSDGHIEDPHAMAAVLRNAVSRLGIKIGKVVAAFPSSRVTFHVVALPAVKGMRPEAVLPGEARRLMGSAVDYYYLFWTPLSKVGLENGTLY